MTVLNHEIDAEDCSSCGTPWRQCLIGGWADTSDGGPHPMDVCCPKCHSTDTHQAEEARRREQERRDASSVSALDRANQMITAAGPIALSQRWVSRLAEIVAGLIEQRDVRDRQAREFRQHAERNGRRAQDLETELRGTQELLRRARDERGIVGQDRSRALEEMVAARTERDELARRLDRVQRRVEAGAEELAEANARATDNMVRIRQLEAKLVEAEERATASLSSEALLEELQRRLDEPRSD